MGMDLFHIARVEGATSNSSSGGFGFMDPFLSTFTSSNNCPIEYIVETKVKSKLEYKYL
jgi:hypothetical protein